MRVKKRGGEISKRTPKSQDKGFLLLFLCGLCDFLLWGLFVFVSV